MSFNTEERLSYMSANVFPIKILKNKLLLDSIRKHKKILPIHVQLNLTNACNFNCEFCSCKNRDKTQMLSKQKLDFFIEVAPKLGCQSLTVTGGGEPLLFDQLNYLIRRMFVCNIDVGLVTNGVFIDKPETLDLLTWCRISTSDELPIQLKGMVDVWLKNIENTVKKYPYIDWAFSYVISANPYYPLIKKLISFANKNKFTHVRLVSDLENLSAVEDMSRVEAKLKQMRVNDNLVIYQGRKQFTKGADICYISLLKPVISASGEIFPCCGVQYAMNDDTRDYDVRMKMGDLEDLPELIRKQKFFSGENCKRCYYSEYNNLLHLLLTDVSHERFV